MKTKSIFMTLVTFLFVVTGFFVSCSSDDSGDGDGGGTVSSITLTSNQYGGIENTEFTFTVKDNLNNDVTADATFTVDGVAATNPYTFTSIGIYEVVAQYSDLTSNTINITIDGETSIILSFSPNPATNTDLVSFIVFNNLGNEVTSSSTFTLDDATITSPYQFPAPGSYEVFAEYNGLSTSSTIAITQGFTKKALLEDFTGTWCPNCPPAANAVTNATNANPNLFGVGYHDGFSSYPDPMEIAETGFWASYYNVTGFPTVYINGPDTRWDFPASSQINTELAEVATCGLALDSEIVGGQLNVEVRVAFNEIPGEEVKLMLYLVEDNVTTSSPQAGSSAGSSYVHRDVLREVYTASLGDVIPAGDISLGSEYTRSFAGLTLPSNIDNMDELKVIAYVRNTYTKTFTDYFGTVHTNSPHYDIYNVQEVEMGGSIDFD